MKKVRTIILSLFLSSALYALIDVLFGFRLETPADRYIKNVIPFLAITWVVLFLIHKQKSNASCQLIVALLSLPFFLLFGLFNAFTPSPYHDDIVYKDRNYEVVVRPAIFTTNSDLCHIAKVYGPFIHIVYEETYTGQVDSLKSKQAIAAFLQLHKTP